MKEGFLNIYDYLFNYRSILDSRRLRWIDYAKGVAIFLVVYHHSFIGLESSGVVVNSWLININMAVYSFRVPLFFILSGVFIHQGFIKRGLAKYVGYRSRILLYPYILWAFLQVTISFFVQPYINFPWRWQSYLYLFYEPKSTGQLWYLLALYNASVIYVLLYSKVGVRGIGHLIIGIILYLLVPLVIFNSMLQELFINYIYLSMGVVISKFILDKRNTALFSSLKLFLCIMPFFIVSQIYWMKHEAMNPYFIYYGQSGFNLSWLLRTEINMVFYFIIVLIGCVFTINICFILQKYSPIPFLRVIGYHSLYIYLMHIIFEASIRTIFLHVFNCYNAFIILPVQILGSVIGSIMLYNTLLHFNMKFLFEYSNLEFKLFYDRLLLSKDKLL
jgi:fucose 4-O-acetylase-like acetyltransferase